MDRAAIRGRERRKGARCGVTTLSAPNPHPLELIEDALDGVVRSSRPIERELAYEVVRQQFGLAPPHELLWSGALYAIGRVAGSEIQLPRSAERVRAIVSDALERTPAALSDWR